MSLPRAIWARIHRWPKKKTLTESLEELRTESPAGSEEACIRISGKEAPVRLVDVNLRPLFTHPHKNTMPMQRKTAEALFSLVGATYLPRRLLPLLKKYDAFNAVEIFLSAMGLEYSRLVQCESDREFFEQALHALVEADGLFLESELDDAALFEVIATHDIEAVEASVERLRKAVSIWKSLRTTEIIFPGYVSSFYYDANRLIEDWCRLEDFSFDEIYAAFRDWRNLQESYDSVIGKIDELVLELKKKIPDEHALKSIIDQLIKKIQSHRDALETGSIEPADGIEALEATREELLSIYEAILGEMGHEGREHHESRWDAGYSEDDLERCMEILDLNYPEDFNLRAIKTGYRTQAKLHHPDCGGDAEHFNKIYEAYSILTKLVEKEEMFA
jgi:hypothetical protein